ncbi:hypothetical protein BY996DRAFT_6586867 [Phakopsora pachyrhizi]|nr:hypothetical protein BY996DRAFT_6586867 [Phakopsora pachyrhizi]
MSQWTKKYYNDILVKEERKEEMIKTNHMTFNNADVKNNRYNSEEFSFLVLFQSEV